MLTTIERAVIRMEIEHHPRIPGSMGMVARAVFVQLCQYVDSLLAHPSPVERNRGYGLSNFLRTATLVGQPNEIVNAWCEHLESMYFEILRKGREELQKSMRIALPLAVPAGSAVAAPRTG